ncbi:P-loop containing nucleoside triphosphate hydrolase protein [Irpex rosettiformis]|uniref:P-loop containing nucleoside triphosphate hydrolase protein n=1 Tax=Irpex rosettiformis TaxID=378272 RepID=A0ACB8U0X2_9APHY|nr:P-loop containing nucleoside triphosphate hydrolase protein [Irpex rosettiformis]
MTLIPPTSLNNDTPFHAVLSMNYSHGGFTPVVPPTPPARVNWRARAKRITLEDLAKEKKTLSEKRKERVRRIRPDAPWIKEGEKWFEEVKAFESHFKPLLEAERDEDEAVLRERLASWPLQKLQDEGYCITEMQAFWQDRYKYGKPVATFHLGPGIALPPHHRFDGGTQVLVTHLGPLRETAQRGSVLNSTQSQLFVSFPERFKIETKKPWRLDIGRSNTVFDRMNEAVGRMSCDPRRTEERQWRDEIDQYGNEERPDGRSDRELIIHGTYLRDVLLRGFEDRQVILDENIEDEEASTVEEEVSRIDFSGLFQEDSRIVSWARRYSERNPVEVEGDPVLSGLNATQIRAVAMMVNNRVCLVQGPPGTGKTKTIIETVKLLKLQFHIPHPILLCTFTNGAVDNIIEGLVSASLRPLRIGNSPKIKGSLSAYVLEDQMERHHSAPDLAKAKEKAEEYGARLKKLHKDIADLRQKIAGAKSSSAMLRRMGGRLSNMQSEIKRLYEKERVERNREWAIYMAMLTDVIRCADVICTTCLSAASRTLNVIDCPLVLIDEASMSTEPATLVPLMKGSKHVALIGDHKQLPPVITSPEAQAKGLSISLFERLSEENIVPSIMLDVQYRMHPTISRFPSHEFYDKAVRDGTVDARGVVSPTLAPPLSSFIPELEFDEDMEDNGRSKPSVVFLDHVGNESIKDRSRVNLNEANIVCSLVEDLLLRNPTMEGSDIGIIAPYVAQVSLLTRLFTTDAKFLSRFQSVLGHKRAADLSKLDIGTVDGFEGREKDVIIFSTVRNNTSGHIGFLADKRRLNVGLTRAKRGLFIVGSIRTLRQGRVSGDPEANVVAGVRKGADVWKRYAQYLSEERLVVSLKGEQLRRLLYGNITHSLDVMFDFVLAITWEGEGLPTPF